MKGDGSNMSQNGKKRWDVTYRFMEIEDENVYIMEGGCECCATVDYISFNKAIKATEEEIKYLKDFLKELKNAKKVKK
jgi:Fe-S cluster biogenesis protein NfuA